LTLGRIEDFLLDLDKVLTVLFLLCASLMLNSTAASTTSNQTKSLAADPNRSIYIT
jgi:hypothetical protein